MKAFALRFEKSKYLKFVLKFEKSFHTSHIILIDIYSSLSYTVAYFLLVALIIFLTKSLLLIIQA